MNMLSCPNCDTTEPMESDAYSVKVTTNITHTCSECGYSEVR